MKKVIGLAMAVVLLAASAAPAVLFSEDWSGGVDPAKWTVTAQAAGNIVVEDAGGGDMALALKGAQDGGTYSQLWADWIYSTAGYNRGGGGIYMQYKVWYKEGINVQCGIHGGWHFSTAGAIYGTQEAAVDYLYNLFKATVSAEGIQSGPTMTGFTGAWPAANSKDAALLVRITLDDMQGAQWAYSPDDGANWIVDRDTLGTGAGATLTNYLGFGPFPGQAGTTYIDDIVVDVVPEPMTLSLLGLGGVALLRRR